MNPPTEISPSTQLLLDEIRKLFDKFDARWAKQDAVREASRGVPVPTQSAAVRADVVVDNWGGLFDGGDNSDERHYEAPIVADNWGGLSEQPTHVLEERVYEPMKEQLVVDAHIVADNWGGLFEEPARVTEERVYEPAASDSASPQPMKEQLAVDAAATEYTSTDPDAPAPTASAAASASASVGENVSVETSPADPQHQIQELEKPSPSSPRPAAVEDEVDALQQLLERESLTKLFLSMGYEAHGLIRRSSDFNTQRMDHIHYNPRAVPPSPRPPMRLHYATLSDTSLSRALDSIFPDEIPIHLHRANQMLLAAIVGLVPASPGFHPDLRGNDFADELGRGEADLDVKLLGLARYCATSGQLVLPAKIQHHGPAAAGDVLHPEQKLATPVVLKHSRLVFEEMPTKYITSVHSVSYLLFFGAINICEGHKIIVEMIGPNPVALELLLAVNKPQWPPLPFLIQGDIVQFRPTTWPPHWLSFDPGPVFKLELHYSSNIVDYDLMNWFFNWLWKPPWFSFRYYQAVLNKHGKAIAGFLILRGFKFHPYNPCFFIIFLNLMDFKLGYRWTAMACLFPYSHSYGLGWQLSSLLRPSDNTHRSRFNEMAQWPFVTLAFLSLLQKPLWPPQAPSASCAYIQVPKCMWEIFFGQQCIIDIDLFAAWDGTDSIQFCLYVTVVLLWPEFLQENWQCAVCLELALIDVNEDYCQAGCLFADPVLSMLLCGDERSHRVLLDYYTSRELGKNADVVFCTEHQCFRQLNLLPPPIILLGLSFYMGICTFALRGLVIQWPQALVLTVIATALLFFNSKPFGVLQLQHEPYLLVLIPWNVSCLEITLVSMQWSMVRNLHWDAGGDMPAILRSHNARVSRQHVVLGSSDVGDYPYDMLLKHPWPPPVLLHLTHAGAVLWPMQWPSFCCCGADKKSKLLLFRGCRLQYQRLGGKPHFKERGMSAIWANTRHGPDMYIPASPR